MAISKAKRAAAAKKAARTRKRNAAKKAAEAAKKAAKDIEQFAVVADYLEMRKSVILNGGKFDARAKSLLRQSKNRTVSIVVNYKGPNNIGKKTAVIFDVR